MTDKIKKAWGYRHFILFLLWLLYIINYFDRISVLTFLPYIQKDLNLTVVQVGWLASIFFFGYSCAQVLAGYLADRIGPKKTMTIAIWVFSLVTFVTGFVQNFWQFICLRFGLALGEGQHFAPSLRWIANWIPKEEKNWANAFVSSTAGIAPAIVPVVVTQLAALFGGNWRPVFFLLAVPGFVGVWLLWKYVEDWPKTALDKGRLAKEEYDLITSSTGAEETGLGGKTYGPKMFLTDFHFYLYMVGMVILLMLYWGLVVWISTFLVRKHGMDLKTMGIVASLPYIVAFFSMNLGGWLADKLFYKHPKYTSIIAFLGSCPAFYFIGNVTKGDTPMLLLGLITACLFLHFGWGMMFSYPSRRYPKEVVGRAVGVSNAVAQLGSFVGPLIAGYLVVTLPDKSLDFSNVFLFWSILAIVGATVISFLNERQILETPRATAESA